MDLELGKPQKEYILSQCYVKLLETKIKIKFMKVMNKKKKLSFVTCMTIMGNVYIV